MKKLIIRADAGGELGTGHVMRMIALGQAYRRRGGHVLLISVQCPEPIINRVLESGIEHQILSGCELGDAQDSATTLRLCKEHQAHWLVLDGYHFEEEYQQRLAGHDIMVLCVDDYGHCKTWNCDAVLNQNLGAENWAQRNAKRPDTTWLLGSSFALIREEFLQSIRGAKEKKFPARRILVTMGGADPDNATQKILSALEETTLEGLELRVLVGGANPHQEKLAQFAETSRHQIEVLCNIREMPPMYEWADAVISAGGSTCLEWMAFGLPGCIVTIADNQVPVVDEIAKQGLALSLGWFHEITASRHAKLVESWLSGDLRRQSAIHRRPVVDGLGAYRAAAFLAGCPLFLRFTHEGDLATYFEWVNDPTVRANAFQPELVILEDHRKWFTQKIASPHSRLYVAENASRIPIGQIRFDLLENGSWLVGYSIANGFRGKGMSRPLLTEGIRTLSESISTDPRFVAKVKFDNAPSRRALISAGFTEHRMNNHFEYRLHETK